MERERLLVMVEKFAKRSNKNLFLDDFRVPDDVEWATLPSIEWEIVRSFIEFKKWIASNGIPRLVSFDHDLLPEHYKPFSNTPLPVENTGFEACSWLISFCKSNSLNFPKWIVHSRNNRAVLKMVDFLLHEETSWDKGVTWSYR